MYTVFCSIGLTLSWWSVQFTFKQCWHCSLGEVSASNIFLSTLQCGSFCRLQLTPQPWWVGANHGSEARPWHLRSLLHPLLSLSCPLLSLASPSLPNPFFSWKPNQIQYCTQLSVGSPKLAKPNQIHPNLEYLECTLSQNFCLQAPCDFWSFLTL